MKGQGEPFLTEFTTAAEPTASYQKNISGNAIHTNHGTATQHYTVADCEKERDGYRAERDQARQEAESLRAQLLLQANLIASKEETIALLRTAANRPN